MAHFLREKVQIQVLDATGVAIPTTYGLTALISLMMKKAANLLTEGTIQGGAEEEEISKDIIDLICILFP